VTYHLVDVADVGQKSTSDVKGRRNFKVYQKRIQNKIESVKRKLKSRKVHIVGIRKLAKNKDDTDMK